VRGELLGQDAIFTQSLHLILDEGEEGGEDDRHAWVGGGRGREGGRVSGN